MYPIETGDHVMSANVQELADAVIGHRIVKVENEKVDFGSYHGVEDSLVITLDNGRRVALADTGDCCAYTALQTFLLNPQAVDHMILGVGTTDNYTTWHIFADFGDIMELQVGWSEGSGYYMYGFNIKVQEIEDAYIPKHMILEGKG